MKMAREGTGDLLQRPSIGKEVHMGGRFTGGLNMTPDNASTRAGEAQK